MGLVFCRSCGREIDASAATCPHCGVGQGAVLQIPADAVPEGVRGWSWGAFLLTWIWAIGNSTWIGLLALFPPLWLIMAIILGIKGREWAWKNARWDNLEHFNRVQRRWSILGLVLVLGFFLLIALVLIVVPAAIFWQFMPQLQAPVGVTV
jgi:zinc-ribbon domain